MIEVVVLGLVALYGVAALVLGIAWNRSLRVDELQTRLELAVRTSDDEVSFTPAERFVSELEAIDELGRRGD